jgi:hypothetical protein
MTLADDIYVSCCGIGYQQLKDGGQPVPVVTSRELISSPAAELTSCRAAAGSQRRAGRI